MAHTGAPHFMTRNANFEVQFKHNFLVYIEGLDEMITLSTNSFPLPTFNTAEEEVAFGNQSMFLAGKETIDGGSFVVNDYVELDVEKQLWDWKCKVYNPETGVRGKQQDYKKTITIVQLLGDMESGTRKWICEGCWPMSFELGELSYEDATKKQITMTIKFDNAYLSRN